MAKLRKAVLLIWILAVGAWAGIADATTTADDAPVRETSSQIFALEELLAQETRTSHADSVLIRVRAQLIQPSPQALLYLEAHTLRQDRDYSAAADSFSSLADSYRLLEDPLAAHVAVLWSARCGIDQGSSEDLSRARSEVESSQSQLTLTGRWARETDLVLANLHFLVDELPEAEAIYRDLLNEDLPPHIRADALNALGGINSKKRQLDASLDFYSAAVELGRQINDPSRLSLYLSNLGYQETNFRKFEEATRHLEEAEQICLQRGYRRLLGPIKAGQGAVASMSGNRPEAVRLFGEAVTLSEAGGNHQTELGSRQRLAYNLALMGHYEESRQHFEICLETLERTGGQFIKNWVLGGLAVSTHKLGYLDQAADYYRQAQQVNLEMGDQMSAAWCLNSLATIQAQLGNYRQALVTNQEVMAQYLEMGDREGEGDVRASLGEIYLSLGNFDQAVQQCGLALTLAEQVGSVELLRRAVHTMASAYSATGQSLLAEEKYLQVIDIARQWNDVEVEAWARNDLARHYLNEGRRQEARELLQQVIRLMNNEPYYHLRSQTCLLMAEAADHPSEAVKLAEEALGLAEEAGLPDRQWRALTDLGHYLYRTGEMEGAETCWLRAVDLLESLRQRAGSDELRRHMLRPSLQPYERLMRYYVEQEKEEAAFTILERSRAQVLAGRLHQAQGQFSAAGGRPTDSQERDLAAGIAFIQSQLQESGLSPSVRDSLRQRVIVLENDFDLLKLRWSKEEEQAGSALYPQVPEARELRSILSSKEHLVSYFLADGHSYLFSVNRSEIKCLKLPNRVEIEDKVGRFLLLQRHALDGNQSLPVEVMLKARQELYRMLLEPVAADLDSRDVLVVVPDGILHRVPFSYLHDGQQFVVEKKEVFVVPSLQTLGYLRGRASRQKVAPPRGVLAVGCAGESEPRLHPYTDAPVTALPHADEEAWRLAQIFDDAVILTGHAANEETVRAAVQKPAGVIHFAAHSYADEKDYRHSYMVLNQAPGDTLPSERGDGLLQWQEIVGLNLKTSLVTLASCRSAAGVVHLGEGITGLTQAFLHAGSGGVLASLTDVPDRGTSWVMDRFYKELNKGATAAEALRAAQLAGLAQGDDGIPVGSAFVLVGDGALTYHRNRDWRVGYYLAGILVLGAALWWMGFKT